MKRLHFFKSLAVAAAAATSIPADLGAVTLEDRVPAQPLDLEVTRLRVGTHATADLRHANRQAREAGRPQPFPDPPDDENNYWAEAIRWWGRYFYRVESTIVECSEKDYTCVIRNPSTYYFSRALVLHYRIQHKRDGIDDPCAFGREA